MTQKRKDLKTKSISIRLKSFFVKRKRYTLHTTHSDHNKPKISSSRKINRTIQTKEKRQQNINVEMILISLSNLKDLLN